LMAFIVLIGPFASRDQPSASIGVLLFEVAPAAACVSLDSRVSTTFV